MKNKKIKLKTKLIIAIVLLFLIIAIFPILYFYGENWFPWLSKDISIFASSIPENLKINSDKSIIPVNNSIPITRINLDKTELDIFLGDSFGLTVSILPIDATDKSVIWESSNTEIVTIDDTGTLKGCGIGKASITVKNSTGNFSATCQVQVNPIAVEQISLDDSTVTLGVGEKYVLLESISPKNATHKEVVWSSSDTSVLKVSNGTISAISAGKATVSSTTDKGLKVAKCSFTVTASKSKAKKMYAKTTVNLRTGPSTGYRSIGSTKTGEEIEILKDVGNSWSKIRLSDGSVGYSNTSSAYFTASKPVHIANVPYLNQFSLGYPTGCEAISAVMLLKYYGCTVTPEGFISKLKCGMGKTKEADGTWYAANPFEEFVGHPSQGLGAGAYGCFSKPIVDVMKQYTSRVKNVSDCSTDTLFSYVASGKPVVVWGVKNGNPYKGGVTWKYKNSDNSFYELVGEHCFVLIGYDADYVYLNDPSAGQNVTQPKSKFINNWKAFFSQAIIIE